MDVAHLVLTPQLDGVTMHGPPYKSPQEGTLCNTGHQLIFSSRKEGVEELWLLQQNIDVVERKVTKDVPGGILVIKCKDFRVISFEISSTDDFNDAASSIESVVYNDKVTLLYPFSYRPTYRIVEDGWSAFRPEAEFSKLTASEEWRLTNVNKDFSVCPTYPSLLLVPKCIDDDVVIASAKFRSGGRFPVLCYRHTNGCVLLRSSQPLTGSVKKQGLTGRSKEDEKLLNAVLGPGKRGYIFDTRTQTIAQADRTKGGGFEIEMHYPQWRRCSRPIERHHVFLDSLTKLVEACNDTNSSVDKWLSRLESSNWLTHVRNTLDVACLAAQCLDQEGWSVLVHGADGLDATLLVTSLAQVILNPDCRTIRGLEALIEREWLQAGHPFRTRHKRGCFSTTNTGRSKAQAPTFLLFLDCIYQIQNQFLFSFEFTPSFLSLLFQHSYASDFGTFLGDCEAERISLNLSEKTTSLWSYLNRPDILHKFLNPLYDPNNRIIWPSVAPVSLVLWRELFLKWSVDQTHVKESWDAIYQLKSADKELRMKAVKLKKQLTELEKEAVQAGILSSTVKEMENGTFFARLAL